MMVVANVRRPKCDARLFYKEPLKEFEMKLLPQSLQHPGFCRDRAFSRPMQLLRRKQTGKESKWKWKELAGPTSTPPARAAPSKMGLQTFI